MIDHILLIGFGGPTKPDEVRPFLEEVTRGTRVPPDRLEEVAHHYEQTGGASPYNACATQLFQRLREGLRTVQIDLPLFLGMRHWHPFLAETIRTIHGRGLRRGLGVVLAPHRSEASFEKYLNGVEEVVRQTGAAQLRYEYLQPWHDHPLFIEAQADRVRAVLNALPSPARHAAHLLFTAHSIPVDMARRSRYEEEIRASSMLVANALGSLTWHLAYQSRSGSPHQPWLGPDVSSMLQTLHQQQVDQVLFVPIGFLFDHTEVLYDLDIEATRDAQRLGMRSRRASTVMDHPKFVTMLVELIRRSLARSSAQTRKENVKRAPG